MHKHRKILHVTSNKICRREPTDRKGAQRLVGLYVYSIYVPVIWTVCLLGSTTVTVSVKELSMTIFKENSSGGSVMVSCIMGMMNPASVAPAGKSTRHMFPVKSKGSEKEQGAH